MGPEIWVGIAAVFFSGGAIGAVGTLLAQWLIGRVGWTGSDPRLPPPDTAALRAEVVGLARKLEDLDARVDFQEQLLGGSLQPSKRPTGLTEGESAAEPD